MTIPIQKTMSLVVTDAGRDAAIDAIHGGLDLVLTHIAVGDGQVPPTRETTALAGERIRAEIMSWAKPAPATIEVQALVISPHPLWVAREIGIYAGGVLVAAGFRASGLVEVSNGVPYAFSGSLSLIDLPADTVITVDAELTLDLAFIDPIAAMFRLLVRLTRANADQELRIRTLEGRPTGGPRRFG